MRKGVLCWLVPAIFVGAFLLFPIYLLVLRFPDIDLFQAASRHGNVIKFTFFQATVSAIFTAMLGIPGAFLMNRTKLPKLFKSLLNAASMVPFVLPGITMAVGFLLTFGNSGVINAVLSRFGIQLSILYTFPAIIMGHVFYNFPLFMRIVGDSWSKIDGDILEAASIDGCDGWKKFVKVELPLIFPSILTSFLLSFVYCFTSFSVVLILGGIRYSTLEVSIYMYLRVLLDFDSALSLTILQILFISSVSLLTGIFSSRTTSSAGKTVKERFPLWGYLYSFVAVVVVFLPLSMSIVGGFVSYGGGFTLNNFRNLFSSALRYVLGVTPLFTIIFTMALALFTAVLTLTIAFFSSYSSVRGKQKFSSVVCFVPTAVSAATIAFGLVMLSRVASLPIPFLLIVVYTLISLPIVHGMMENAWRNTPVEIEEAASLDGAGLFSMLFRIRFPMMRKEILGSLAFASAISIGEMTATIILSEPPFTTMSVLTYRLLSTRHLPEAQAMNSILAWIVLGLFFIVETAGSEH